MRTWPILVVAVVLLVPGIASAQDERGRELYDKYCAQCHGQDGAGDGVATPRVKPKPRDLTSGKFKIRTTPSGRLPTDEDIRKMILDGMPYTSMPPWRGVFNRRQVDDLVAVTKSFYPGFADADPEPIDIPEPPAWSEESAERGREVYEALGCARCHGEQGRGDGPSAPTLTDDWDDHIRASDLTKPWTFRGGPTRRDVFRAFSTGLNGTPMPSYADSLEVDERWDLVDYIVSLSDGPRPDYSIVVQAVAVDEQISLDNVDELFADAPPARFPIVGQIVEPGREFHPSATDVVVRAVYNPLDVAIEVRWNDMRAETSGTNAPDIEVPRFEERETPTAIEPEEDTGFWGEEAVEEDDGGFWGEEEETTNGGFWEEDEVTEGLAPDQEFSDAVAVQFPSELTDGAEKPYFLFGDPTRSVDLWFQDLGTDVPELFVGRGSDQLESRGARDLESMARYEDGEWRVVFKRSARVRGQVPLDQVGSFVPIAFSVWDGFNRERGNKRGLTLWFDLYLRPEGEEASLWPVVQAGLLVLGLEILVIVWVRRRNSAPDGVRV